MVRVDLERREIVASVRDLAFPAGAMPRSAGRFGALRAELGSVIHRRYARSRERSEPGFRSEVSLEMQHTVDGFTVRLSGRLDGLIEMPGVPRQHLCAEEVKSLDAPAERVLDTTLDDVPAAVLQVRLYALMLTRTRPDDPPPVVAARVVVVSILDGSELTLDVPFSARDTERELDRALRRQIAAAEDRAQLARERAARADSLRFPYGEHRLHQDELVDAIRTGLADDRPVLAEAPTGIGKTIAALLPALRHALTNDAIVFYLTAKRTQRQRVAETFGDLASTSGLSPGSLRAMTLRPRQDMCPTGTFTCQVDLCPLLANLHDATRRERAVRELLEDVVHVTPQTIYEKGERESLCPHVLARILCAHVDVVIGDYNHLYGSVTEPGVFPGSAVPRKLLVVVDEAHNLLDRAREYDSVFLSRRRVESVARSHGDVGRLAADVVRQIDATVASADGSGEQSRDGCAVIDRDAEPWDTLASDGARTLAQHLQSGAAAPGPRHEDPVVEMVDTIVRLRDLLRRDEPYLVPYASVDPCGRLGAGVGVCCVDPADRLQKRHKQMVGTVAMSATLSPLPHYRDALGFAELAPVEVSLPSPFPPENRCVVVVPDVSTTWRDRARSYGRIAREIEGVIAMRPGHYVAFFPSYRYLSDVREQLRVDERQLVEQRARMPDTERDAILDRLRHDPEPVLLLAVSGGVFAEGIDLPGDALIGAIVVGPSLPAVSFERDAMRRYHDERGEDGFARAMLYPGMQRVIQAAGRVHRTAEDRGIIVLLGRRFESRSYSASVPEYWKSTCIVSRTEASRSRAVCEFWLNAVAVGGRASCSITSATATSRARSS